MEGAAPSAPQYLGRDGTQPSSRGSKKLIEEPLLQSRDGEFHLPAHPRDGAEERQREVAAPAEQAAVGLEEWAEHLGENGQIAGVSVAFNGITREGFAERDL